jgi:hypothetical protein
MNKININDANAWSQLDWDEPVIPEALKKTDAKVNLGRSNRLNGLQRKGKKGPPKTEETKALLSVIRKGKPATNKGVPHTEEHKAKLAAAGTGRVHSDETRAKQSEKAKDRVVSDETKAKLSASNKGKPSPKKGIPRPKLTCPHCGLEGGNSSMKRWHFDNCKLK